MWEMATSKINTPNKYGARVESLLQTVDAVN